MIRKIKRNLSIDQRYEAKALSKNMTETFTIEKSTFNFMYPIIHCVKILTNSYLTRLDMMLQFSSSFRIRYFEEVYVTFIYFPLQNVH